MSSPADVGPRSAILCLILSSAASPAAKSESLHHRANRCAFHCWIAREGASAMLSSEGIHLACIFEPVASDNAAIFLNGCRRWCDFPRPLTTLRTRGKLSLKHSRRFPMHRLHRRRCSTDHTNALASVFRMLASYFHGRDQTTDHSMCCNTFSGISANPRSLMKVEAASLRATVVQDGPRGVSPWAGASY